MALCPGILTLVWLSWLVGNHSKQEARSGITLMAAPGLISTRGSLLSFFRRCDRWDKEATYVCFFLSRKRRCLLSRRLYPHSGLSSLVLPCTHLRCFELPSCWRVGHTFLSRLLSKLLYTFKSTPIYGAARLEESDTDLFQSLSLGQSKEVVFRVKMFSNFPSVEFH